MIEAGSPYNSDCDNPTATSNPFKPGHAEVEGIVDRRQHKGILQYKVKWKGWNNRYNCWRDEGELECSGLIDRYNDVNVGYSQGQVCMQVMCMAICLVVSGSVLPSALADLDVSRAVHELAAKQSISVEPAEFESGYVTELLHMMSRRLEMVTEQTAREYIRSQHKVVPLRMLLEAKKDGRRKARLILQGFREPTEWDLDSNISPVCCPSVIRSLLFMSGRAGDVISSIDVSVAFLQSELYGPDEQPRYVSYKPYSGGLEYLFRLLGPVYGQRSAGRAWFKTVTSWLVGEMGYMQGKNEPCVFVHPNTGHRIALYCDDFLCRGSRTDSERFYAALSRRFNCKDPTYLDTDTDITFTGIDISMSLDEGQPVYRMDQTRDLVNFLDEKGIRSVKHRSSPMPDKSVLLNDEPIGENLQSWCRSVIGGLHFYARGTRWDIAQAVSRVAQTMHEPTKGTVDSIEVIAGYLADTLDFGLEGRNVPDVPDVVESMCDSSHHGDPKVSSKSQSGVVVLLNGVPVHWRSNKQPNTTLSPVESEVYALSVGVKDVRLMGWLLEELGVDIRWPMVICSDSPGAAAFKEDVCPYTKLKGCFDFRWKWVEELRSSNDIITKFVTDEFNLADIFTKCMPTGKFLRKRNQLTSRNHL